MMAFSCISTDKCLVFCLDQSGYCAFLPCAATKMNKASHLRRYLCVKKEIQHYQGEKTTASQLILVKNEAIKNTG